MERLQASALSAYLAYAAQAAALTRWYAAQPQDVKRALNYAALMGAAGGVAVTCTASAAYRWTGAGERAEGEGAENLDEDAESILERAEQAAAAAEAEMERLRQRNRALEEMVASIAAREPEPAPTPRPDSPYTVNTTASAPTPDAYKTAPTGDLSVSSDAESSMQEKAEEEEEATEEETTEPASPVVVAAKEEVADSATATAAATPTPCKKPPVAPTPESKAASTNASPRVLSARAKIEAASNAGTPPALTARERGTTPVKPTEDAASETPRVLSVRERAALYLKEATGLSPSSSFDTSSPPPLEAITPTPGKPSRPAFVARSRVDTSSPPPLEAITPTPGKPSRPAFVARSRVDTSSPPPLEAITPTPGKPSRPAPVANTPTPVRASRAEVWLRELKTRPDEEAEAMRARQVLKAVTENSHDGGYRQETVRIPSTRNAAPAS